MDKEEKIKKIVNNIYDQQDPPIDFIYKSISEMAKEIAELIARVSILEKNFDDICKRAKWLDEIEKEQWLS